MQLLLGVAAVAACHSTGTSGPPNATATVASAPAVVVSAPETRDAAAASPESTTLASASPAAEAPRAFLLQLLDVARRHDAAAWSQLQSPSMRARNLESAPQAELRMASWENDLDELETAIRSGRVFTAPSGGRTVILVETPEQPTRAVAFVTVENGELRLDEN